MGLGSTLMPDALTIAAQDSDTITIEMIEAAQTIAGISFTREEQQAIVTRLNATRGYLAGFRFLQTANLGNHTQPAIVFNPVPPGKALPAGPRGLKRREPVGVEAVDRRGAGVPAGDASGEAGEDRVRSSRRSSPSCISRG